MSSSYEDYWHRSCRRINDLMAENAKLRELLAESRSLFGFGVRYGMSTTMVGREEAIRDAQVITKAIDAALKGAE